MTNVTCSGLVAGDPPYSKEITTVDLYGPNMTTQGVQITISLDAYRRLVNWASMGRTLNGVLNALADANSFDMYEELAIVKNALDECHQAVRRHWYTQQGSI